MLRFVILAYFFLLMRYQVKIVAPCSKSGSYRESQGRGIQLEECSPRGNELLRYLA